MDENFLENLLGAVIDLTTTERGLAVDSDLAVQKARNIDSTLLESEEFMEFTNGCLREALDSGDTVFTNNVITDLSDAPTTNTTFSNLRVIVALPIETKGAIYIDQHIKNGVIHKEIIAKIERLIDELLPVSDQPMSKDEMVKRFKALD